MAQRRRRTRKKKKEKKVVPHGIAHIQATFNNTIITITDPDGNVLCWSSAGKVGVKGTRKGTPWAAQMAAKQAAQEAMQMGMRSIDIRVKGPGPGREAAIRTLHQAGLQVKSIKDVTPIPHNGCRPRRPRRV